MESAPELDHDGRGLIASSDDAFQKLGFAGIEGSVEAHILDSPEAREAERKYIWKLDLIILPTISALYFFEYIDRGNIAVNSSCQVKRLNIRC